MKRLLLVVGLLAVVGGAVCEDKAEISLINKLGSVNVTLYLYTGGVPAGSIVAPYNGASHHEYDCGGYEWEVRGDHGPSEIVIDTTGTINLDDDMTCTVDSNSTGCYCVWTK